jgi:putative ABC transport system substrate-binding protein
VPKAGRVAVLVNPSNTAAAEATLKEAHEVAPALGLQIVGFKAGTIGEIDAAFAGIARERGDALPVGGDGLFFTGREQVATLTARDRLPSVSAVREFAEPGGLMSYGTKLTDMFRQSRRVPREHR